MGELKVYWIQMAKYPLYRKIMQRFRKLKRKYGIRKAITVLRKEEK